MMFERSTQCTICAFREDSGMQLVQHGPQFWHRAHWFWAACPAWATVLVLCTLILGRLSSMGQLWHRAHWFWAAWPAWATVMAPCTLILGSLSSMGHSSGTMHTDSGQLVQHGPQFWYYAHWFWAACPAWATVMAPCTLILGSLSSMGHSYGTVHTDSGQLVQHGPQLWHRAH